MIKIGIIGAGELGQALGQVLSSSDTQIAYWDKDEGQLLNLAGVSLAELMEQSDFVFYCLPTSALREALAFSAGYWRSGQIAVFFSKGLDPQTGKLAHELATKMLPRQTGLAVISGAMIAEELKVGHLGFALVASNRSNLGAKVQEIFAGTTLWLAEIPSLEALAWVGVLKNVYALGLGDLVGKGALKNEQGFYFARAVNEINFLLKKLTGENNFILKPELLADFWATANSQDSANYKFGLLLGQGAKPQHFCEANSSAQAIKERLGDYLPQTPILAEIIQLLDNLK